MDKYEQLAELLKEFPSADVKRYVSYCKGSELAKQPQSKGGGAKFPWFGKLSAEKLAEFFERVHGEGLTFDGEHITLQSTGISYDYQAYKNKMLLAYPETVIDMQLVYEGDVFETWKDSGKVRYKHQIADPFEQTEDKIRGGYVVIRNTRGEFLTTMTKEDLEKHRRAAKTDYIWRAWLKEMYLKTLMRKATKYHFDDVFQTMNEVDNEHMDPEKVTIDMKIQNALAKCDSADEVDMCYNAYKDEVEDEVAFIKMLTKRKEELS